MKLSEEIIEIANKLSWNDKIIRDLEKGKTHINFVEGGNVTVDLLTAKMLVKLYYLINDHNKPIFVKNIQITFLK